MLDYNSSVNLGYPLWYLREQEELKERLRQADLKKLEEEKAQQAKLLLRKQKHEEELARQALLQKQKQEEEAQKAQLLQRHLEAQKAELQKQKEITSEPITHMDSDSEQDLVVIGELGQSSNNPETTQNSQEYGDGLDEFLSWFDDSYSVEDEEDQTTEKDEILSELSEKEEVLSDTQEINTINLGELKTLVDQDISEISIPHSPSYDDIVDKIPQEIYWESSPPESPKTKTEEDNFDTLSEVPSTVHDLVDEGSSSNTGLTLYPGATNPNTYNIGIPPRIQVDPYTNNNPNLRTGGKRIPHEISYFTNNTVILNITEIDPQLADSSLDSSNGIMS